MWVSKEAMRWRWRRRTTAGNVVSTAAGSVELEIIDWVKSVFQMVNNYAVLQVESFCSRFLCHPSFVFLVCLSAPIKPYRHKLFPNLRDSPSSTFAITLSAACSFAFSREKTVVTAILCLCVSFTSTLCWMSAVFLGAGWAWGRR